jgi:hypothetical protein
MTWQFLFVIYFNHITKWKVWNVYNYLQCWSHRRTFHRNTLVGIENQNTVKPVYNEQIGQKRSLKTSFRYNRSIFKQIYAIGVNDVLSYNREFVITEWVINGFNCIKPCIKLFNDIRLNYSPNQCMWGKHELNLNEKSKIILKIIKV